jgi:hypothetical protein
MIRRRNFLGNISLPVLGYGDRDQQDYTSRNVTFHRFWCSAPVIGIHVDPPFCLASKFPAGATWGTIVFPCMHTLVEHDALAVGR